MVKISSAVRNISMKTPCTREVPPPRVVVTSRGTGRRASTMAAAVIPPSICAVKRVIALRRCSCQHGGKREGVGRDFMALRFPTR